MIFETNLNNGEKFQASTFYYYFWICFTET